MNEDVRNEVVEEKDILEQVADVLSDFHVDFDVKNDFLDFAETHREYKSLLVGKPKNWKSKKATALTQLASSKLVAIIDKFTEAAGSKSAGAKLFYLHSQNIGLYDITELNPDKILAMLRATHEYED